MKLPNCLKSPIWLLALYILTICAFALTYYCLRDLIPAPNNHTESVAIGFIDALYLSIVTITTLGYGDITASTPWLRVVTAAEAVIGIILLGLAISALWSEQQKATAEKKAKRKLSNCYTIIQSIFSSHLVILAALLNDKSTGTPDNTIPETIEIRHLRNVFQSLDLKGNSIGRNKWLLDYFTSVNNVRSNLLPVVLSIEFDGFEKLESSMSRLVSALDYQPFKATLLNACELPDSKIEVLQRNLEDHNDLTGSRVDILETIKMSSSADFYPFYIFKWNLTAQKKLIDEIDEYMRDLYYQENPDSRNISTESGVAPY